MIISSALALSLATPRPILKLVDINDRLLFNGSGMVDSPANEKLGIYVFADPRFNSKTLNKALDVLKKVDIPYLFKKEADGTIAGWGIDGKAETVKAGDLPSSLLKELKTDRPVLKLQQQSNYHPMGLPRANVLYNVRSNLVVDDLKPQKLTTFMPLEQPRYPFVRVFFRMHVPLEVGKIKPVPGTSKTVDGIEFKVGTAFHSHSAGSPIDETKILHCNVVIDQMAKSKAYPGQSYVMAIKVDDTKYRADFPADTSKEYSYCSAASQDGTPYATRFYVHSNRPAKYWKEVSITQSSFLEGYMGHLPTAPLH